MKELTVIKHKEQRVLTTQQLAEVYETDAKIINKNFERNRERYIEGKHYFALTGEQLREFKGERQNDESLKYVSVLYLWTEAGTLRHAKSLGTDKAWEVFEKLEESYFRVRELNGYRVPKTYAEALLEAGKLAMELEKKQKALEEAKPKVEAYNIFLSAGNSQTMNQVAKVIGIGRNKLFAILRDKKILRKNNEPYQEHIDLGRFELREVTVTHSDWTENKTQTLVTAKGMDYIRKLLKEEQIEAAN